MQSFRSHLLRHKLLVISGSKTFAGARSLISSIAACSSSLLNPTAHFRSSSFHSSNRRWKEESRDSPASSEGEEVHKFSAYVDPLTGKINAMPVIDESDDEGEEAEESINTMSDANVSSSLQELSSQETDENERNSLSYAGVKWKSGKTKTTWVCENCGDIQALWWGTCPNCGVVGRFKCFEQSEASKSRGAEISEALVSSWLPQESRISTPKSLAEVNTGIDMSEWRIPLEGHFGLEFCRVLGGGVVPDKPPIGELHQFLDFQLPRQWAPVYYDLQLGPQRRKQSSASLQFSFMGPKLYVNTSMVDVGRKPVTGLRLYLEGKRSNRLAIHLQHLCSRPQIFQLCDNASNHFSTDSHDRKYYEPVSWPRCSHICTAPVEPDDDLSIVTGAQLHVGYHGLKKVLFLRLQFSSVSNAVSVKDPQWEGSPNSAVYPGGPPVPVQTPKLLKFVDTTEMSRGPQDSPGYWVVSGAKLHLERGKISLRVRYSLMTALLPDEEYE